MRTLVVATFLTILFASSTTTAAVPDNQQLQSLVDQLREITEKARKERAADRWLLNELEDLVSRHDWPWRNELLNEDFSDGNYNQNPAWNVISGQFWVDGRLGLRSRSEPEEKASAPQAQEQKKDLGKALLGALLQEAMRGKERQAPEPVQKRDQPAEIQLDLQIPTVYALQLEFSAHTPPQEAGQIEYSLYQGKNGDTGYRLILTMGDRSSMELLSRINGKTRVIERVEFDNISDGQTHAIEWRRDPNGQIEVLLDEQLLVRTRDSSFRNPFTQLSIRNQGGDFAIGSVTLHGS
ncbi:hypothetical protein [Sedimenticola selenatireducens]|uniref:Uncharacterized protein n=1 Tax=Sedimenticola selenatireducens TaxID=191960 RepID=A0A558DLN7_9GAMM|nr:hypothetical protein [Sedimenticola selenatireducens]TVO69543.1 hypothetical protein FHP88_18005 [Sedimenticola selenatireducens]TVT61936.1 MAG: hypothetical protein FHK78_16220 [Sedimenticola selenatireducens]